MLIRALAIIVPAMLLVVAASAAFAASDLGQKLQLPLQEGNRIYTPPPPPPPPPPKRSMDIQSQSPSQTMSGKSRGR